MVHENADRAHVPGHPQVPERDIEPLWPPEQTDPTTAVPPWAAPSQPGAPAWPAVPPDAAAPAPGVPVGGAPTGPARDATATGAATDDVTRAGDAGNGPPAPRPARPPVDLDLPFTLDQPAVAPGRSPGADGPSADTPAAGPAGSASAGSGAGGGSGAPDRSSNGSGQADDLPAGSRTDSPWAQPPQRSTTGPAEPATDAPGPDAVPPPLAAPATPAAAGPSTAAAPAPGPEVAGTPTVGPPIPATPTAAPSSAAQPLPEAPSAGAPSAGPPAGGPPADGQPEAPPSPRLGPFPPSPGVPLPQSAYGNGTGYPPGPGGYGQPDGSAYPPPPAAGGVPPTPTPDWYPSAWPQQGTPPQQPGPPQQPAPAAYPEPAWTPEGGAPPTAEDFARRRQARPLDPVATMGVRAVVNRLGLVRLPPGQHEQEVRRDIEMVRRNFGGLRQVTVVNPKGGAGKTVAILLLAMTFGQKRGGYVLAWDNNETQGTLGMRAQQDFHSRTVRDMLRDLAQFQGAHGRVGDLSQYVRSQGEGMFDVLASDESATGGEMLTAAAFAEIREVVSRFYKLIFVDTGNNVRAQNWQAAMDATDQLVVTMSARNDSAETAARMLDHLEQSGRQRLVRQAVTVVSMPPSRKEIDLPAIQGHFAARTRAVLLAPYERLIDTGEPIRYGQLSSATRDAWLKIAAAVAEGL
ncbi:chromosome partitioning protein [Micromonospora sp. NPDC007230]|uniref:chromosome partitioning protein n=1 Tax=Micromonospora sp. NPDC007230 TaxID=3364237 RepID=UPI00367FED9D